MAFECFGNKLVSTALVRP